MDAILNTAEWLRRPVNIAPMGEISNDGLAALALLSASLEHATTFPTPSASLQARIDAALDALPPQVAMLDGAGSIGQWLRVATLAEHWGEPRLAQIVIDRISALVRQSADDEIAGALRSEWLGVCAARRGRLSRTTGLLDDAEAWYRTARRLGQGAVWRDARAQAEIGLALVAINRGDLSRGTRLAVRILRQRPPVPPLYAVQAHQMLAFTMRRSGKPLDALLHGWSAYDLLDRDDFRRSELVVAMAEIAAEYGDLDAAATGFQLVIHESRRPRIMIPAVIGIVEVSVCLAGGTAEEQSRGRDQLRSYLPVLEALVSQTVSPAEQVLALLALAEGLCTLDERARATSCIGSASELAEKHCFYAYQFRIDSLRTKLEREPQNSESHVGSDRREAPNVVLPKHPALARFARAGASLAQSRNPHVSFVTGYER